MDFDHELLTPHFARWEFSLSDTAVRRDIPNAPSAQQWESLKLLSETCLEPARVAFGPIRITSGFRCPALNTIVGGAPSSQHMKGEAADIIPMLGKLQDLFVWLNHNADFDQLIWEFGKWIHVSHTMIGTQRHGVLLAYRKNGKTVYAPITEDQLKTL